MRGRTRPALIWMLVLAAVAALGLAACGAKASGGPGAPGPTTGQPSPPATIHVGDHDNGRKYEVPVGTRIEVVLGSTYWSFRPSSDRAVVAPDGAASVSPSPGCVPGQGCGTVTQTYVVRSDGNAVLSASRTSCGEALLCRMNLRRFQVTITAG